MGKEDKKEIKDVYTGFVVDFTFPEVLYPVDDTNLNALPGALLALLFRLGLTLKAYAYRVIPVPGQVGLFTVNLRFLICPGDLSKLQEIIGTTPPITSGTLADFPYLAPLLAILPSTTALAITFQEAVILATRCVPSYCLRENLLAYIQGSGFTVNSLALLGKNIIITANPRDIRPTFDAKLIIGSILPLIGAKCE